MPMFGLIYGWLDCYSLAGYLLFFLLFSSSTVKAIIASASTTTNISITGSYSCSSLRSVLIGFSSA